MPYVPLDYTAEERAEHEAFVGRLADRIEKSFARFSRRSGPGPAANRLEHWQCLAGDDVNGRAVAKVLARFALGRVPEDVKDALRSARLNGAWKTSGDVLCSGVGASCPWLATLPLFDMAAELVSECLHTLIACPGHARVGH